MSTKPTFNLPPSLESDERGSLSKLSEAANHMTDIYGTFAADKAGEIAAAARSAGKQGIAEYFDQVQEEIRRRNKLPT